MTLVCNAFGGTLFVSPDCFVCGR